MNHCLITELPPIDEVFAQIEAGNVYHGLQRLKLSLNEFRLNSEQTVWREFVATCAKHPLARFVHQSEMSRRAFEKPRGYAGDAVLLDLIYGIKTQQINNPVVADLCRWEFNLESCKSVRNRKNLLAKEIDQAIGTRPKGEVEVLSVACGHLREVHHSSAVQQRLFRRFVAFDQDPESLATVRRDMTDSGIQCVQGSVIDIIKGKFTLNNFDFIYTAGLFDYLTDSLATRLTTKLFRMLSPGGRLLIANFAPEVDDIGYMQAFLQWDLIYRNEEAMIELLKEIPDIQIAKRKTSRDLQANLVFLEMTRSSI